MDGAGLLAGRAALVTGGTRGLGAAIARTFAAAGATGAVVDLETGDAPKGWVSLVGDVTDERSIRAAVDGAAEELGRLDVVVANAGIVPPWTETAELDLDELDRVLAVNVRGAAATLKHAVPHLRQRGGSIVVMASLNARRAFARQHVYTTSKHAVLGLARSAALDLGRYGIRVNAIGPGTILTELAKTAVLGNREAERKILGRTPLGRLGDPDEVARVAAFLASDDASYVTGQTIYPDGGRLALNYTVPVPD